MTRTELQNILTQEHPISLLADFTGGGESRRNPGRAVRYLLLDIEGEEFYAEHICPEDIEGGEWATTWDDDTSAYLLSELKAWL